MSACAMVNIQPHLNVAELLPVSLHLSCKRLQLHASCCGAACGQLQLPLQTEYAAGMGSLQTH